MTREQLADSDRNFSGSAIDCLILADWLPPDFGAIGQYALQFAQSRAGSGESVCLVGFSSLESSREYTRVGPGKLVIVRIHRPAYDRSNLLRRAAWTFDANLRLLWGARSMLRAAREVIFTGSPPYLLHFIAPLKGWIKGRLRYRIADFHPECLMAMQDRPSHILRMLERVTWFWRSRIDVLEIIAEDQRVRLLSHGIEPDRIELRRDGSPVSFVGASAAERPRELAQRKTLLYSGNWGVAHDAATFVSGLALLSEDERNRMGLWLNATGARADWVRNAANALGIPVVHTPPCRLDQLAGVLLAADAHLITLSDAFVGLVLPSKVYACIESRRPILFVGSADSDVHTLIATARDESGYRRADVGRPEQVADSIRSLMLAARP